MMNSLPIVETNECFGDYTNHKIGIYIPNFESSPISEEDQMNPFISKYGGVPFMPSDFDYPEPLHLPFDQPTKNHSDYNEYSFVEPNQYTLYLQFLDPNNSTTFVQFFINRGAPWIIGQSEKHSKHLHDQVFNKLLIMRKWDITNTKMVQKDNFVPHPNYKLCIPKTITSWEKWTDGLSNDGKNSFSKHNLIDTFFVGGYTPTPSPIKSKYTNINFNLCDSSITTADITFSYNFVKNDDKIVHITYNNTYYDPNNIHN